MVKKYSRQELALFQFVALYLIEYYERLRDVNEDEANGLKIDVRRFEQSGIKFQPMFITSKGETILMDWYTSGFNTFEAMLADANALVEEFIADEGLYSGICYSTASGILSCVSHYTGSPSGRFGKSRPSLGWSVLFDQPPGEPVILFVNPEGEEFSYSAQFLSDSEQNATGFAVGGNPNPEGFWYSLFSLEWEPKSKEVVGILFFMVRQVLVLSTNEGGGYHIPYYGWLREVL